MSRPVNIAPAYRASNATPEAFGDPTRPGALLRLASIIGPGGLIPVSRSTWWAGVKSGRYPQSVKLGARAVAWRASDIAALVEKGIGDA